MSTIEQQQCDAKVYYIDDYFYEFDGYETSESKINHIVEEHKRKNSNTAGAQANLSKTTYGQATYYVYVFNEAEKDAHWKNFLPQEITEHHNFKLLQLSFVLFVAIENRIFAIIGGGGIQVIKRYINQRFGLEIYEHLTIPEEDLVLAITIRGISGFSTEKKELFKIGKTLSDALVFTHIPTRITLLLRDDLKDTVFNFINFQKEKIILELSSCFHLKHQINFESLQQFIIILSKILDDTHTKPLSSFTRIKKDNQLNQNLKTKLLSLVRNDMLNKLGTFRGENSKKLDIDFIHPNKTQEFYECTHFHIKVKNQKAPVATVTDKESLYIQGLTRAYEILGDNSSEFEFNKLILGMRVLGFKENKKKTEAPFLEHITCEISYQDSPHFHIDGHWYVVKNDFISNLNDNCLQSLNKHSLKDNYLHLPWDLNSQSEYEYNSSYESQNGYLVFDKVLFQNIELCDLFFDDGEFINLIHVKAGFDARIRDLANQVLLSAQRLSNDLKSTEPFYLRNLLVNFNTKFSNNKINIEETIEKFRNKPIRYILAFHSGKYGYSANDWLWSSKSNIAKYSMVSCLHDMSNLYPMSIIDISKNRLNVNENIN